MEFWRLTLTGLGIVFSILVPFIFAWVSMNGRISKIEASLEHLDESDGKRASDGVRIAVLDSQVSMHNSRVLELISKQDIRIEKMESIIDLIKDTVTQHNSCFFHKKSISEIKSVLGLRKTAE